MNVINLPGIPNQINHFGNMLFFPLFAKNNEFEFASRSVEYELFKMTSVLIQNEILYSIDFPFECVAFQIITYSYCRCCFFALNLKSSVGLNRIREVSVEYSQDSCNNNGAHSHILFCFFIYLFIRRFIQLFLLRSPFFFSLSFAGWLYVRPAM